MNIKANYAVSEVTLPTTATRLDYAPPEGYDSTNSIPVAALMQNKTNGGWYKNDDVVLKLSYTGRIDMQDYESGLATYGGQLCKILHILL